MTPLQSYWLTVRVKSIGSAVIVLDSSALLAYFFRETGSELVADHLKEASIGAANWCEVLGKVEGSMTRSWADALLMALGVSIEPVTKADAIKAAEIYDRNPSLSLGDRLCLALADRLEAQVLTADRAWGSNPTVVQIRA